MTYGGRAQARSRIMRRFTWVAAVLVVLTLLFVLSGHWVLAAIFALASAAALWAWLQARGVR